MKRSPALLIKMAPSPRKASVAVALSSAATRVAALLSGEVDFVQDVPVQDIARLEQTDGIRVTSSGDEITVTDGPFAEAREAVAGFALVEVSSKEEAIELTRRFRRIVGDGESVIQQVFGP